MLISWLIKKKNIKHNRQSHREAADRQTASSIQIPPTFTKRTVETAAVETVFWRTLDNSKILNKTKQNVLSYSPSLQSGIPKPEHTSILLLLPLRVGWSRLYLDSTRTARLRFNNGAVVDFGLSSSIIFTVSIFIVVSGRINSAKSVSKQNI